MAIYLNSILNLFKKHPLSAEIFGQFSLIKIILESHVFGVLKVYLSNKIEPLHKAFNLECVPLEGYQIIKKLTKDPEAQRACTTLAWFDEDGDEFHYSVTGIRTLKNLFNRFPWVAKDVGANMEDRNRKR